MKLHKVFRFRMRPTIKQAQSLARTAGARRFVWNWALAQCRAHYGGTGRSLPQAELSRRLTSMKILPETTWLNEVDAQSLQQVLADLHRAYVNFFQKRARFPRFKSRKNDRRRFRIPQRVTVSDGMVYVPKVGRIRIWQSRDIDGESKSATFKQDASGHWDVALVTEFSLPDTPLLTADPTNVVGVDLGLKDFAVVSNGARIPAPHFLRKAERRLRRAQRIVARRQVRSRRRLRAKRVVARIYARTANQRNDFLHKITANLVRNNEGICIEDLSVKGLAKTKLAKSVLDAGLGEFRRQLEYKAIWNRRHLAIVDRWYPSSKTCHVCGAVNINLTLADRTWNCVCGINHDRDLNAALNIRAEGLKALLLAAGYAESKMLVEST